MLKGNKPDFHQAMASEQSQAFYQQFLTALKSKYSPDLIKGIRSHLLLILPCNSEIVTFVNCRTVQKYLYKELSYQNVISLTEKREREKSVVLVSV